MLNAAIVAAFEGEESFGEVEFFGQKIDKFLVSFTLCSRGVEGNDKSVVIELADNLCFTRVGFDVNDKNHRFASAAYSAGYFMNNVLVRRLR